MAAMTSLIVSNLMSMIEKLTQFLDPFPSLLASSSSSSSSITASEANPIQERFMEDLRRLSRMLRRIQDVLHDTEEKEIYNLAIQLWLSELRKVAYDAEDVLEEFDYQVIKTQVEGMTHKAELSLKRKHVDDDLYGDQGLLPSSTPIKIPISYNMAQRILKIMDKFDEIAKDGEVLQLRPEDAPRQLCLDDSMKRPPSSSLVHDAVGREVDKKKIIQLLMSNTEEDITVIPIVGMGGVGKTTLARLVYSDSVVCKHFSQKAWVCVSQNFDVLRITKEIMTCIKGSLSHPDNNNLNDLQHMLKQALVQERFLLILDDVWNERPDMWEALSAPFYGVGMAKIIVTTRSKSVARIMQTVPPYVLRCLGEEKSWLLFQRHAFDGWEPRQQLNFEQIGRKITKKCGGLPLALKAIGGFLRHEVEEQMWMGVLNNNLWELKETKNLILPALRISYNHMPGYLKPCFVYASLFPKDHEFEKVELIRMWIAQGYIKLTGGKRLLEDIAFEYFEDLQRRSFFQHSKYDKFILHDVVHDLARSIAKTEICSFLDFDELKNIPTDAKHIFIQHPSVDHVLSFGAIRTFYNPSPLYSDTSKELTLSNSFKESFSYFGCLRVLRFYAPDFECNLQFVDLIGNLQQLRYLSIHVLKIQMAKYSFCSLYKLQTLELKCKELNMLPHAIRKLINLRHLVLHCHDLKMLPKSIYQLENLLTLDIKECCLLRELPLGISKLSNLQHLILSQGYNFYIPREIEKMISLKTLPHYSLRRDSQHSGIGWLKHLMNLRGSLNISKLENVVSREEAESASLHSKPHIESLTLSWSINQNNDECVMQEAVLDGLQPHTNLKELTINGYRGNSFPSWFGNPCFSNLQKIYLINFNSNKECKFLPLSGLPCLRSLEIDDINGLRRMQQDFWCYPPPDGREKNLTEVHVGFHSLEYLTIKKMPEWTATVKNGDFSSLKFLSISSCPQLELLSTLPSSLEELEVVYCNRLEYLALHDSSGPLSRLQKVRIHYCHSLKSVKSLDNVLATLNFLKLSDCPLLLQPNQDDYSHHSLAILSLENDIVCVVNCPGMREWCRRHGFTYQEVGQAIESPENTSEVDDAVIYGRKDDEKKLLLSDDILLLWQCLHFAKFGQAIEPPENTSGVDDAVIYGRKVDEKKLLLSDDCMELDISLIQITGETTSKVGDAVIYGREDDKKKVIQLLLSDDCKKLHISLIQITGAGGIGKSTLAYLVYNDSMTCDYFDIKAWVHMPEVIDVGGILKAVIESLTGISCYVTELNELVQIIEEELSGKRFLIVLDNVRNGTQDFWGSFMVSLSIGAKGSIVMVTTQTEIISDLMGSIRPYHLNSLSDDHCFSIFLEYAFDKQDPCNFPELVRTGKHIAAKCEGVPLAAKAVGGLLHFNENNFPADSQYWKDVLESALWESDDWFPALSLCYDYLPMHLKLCFRYCSLFPEGYIFEKDHLIGLWMSQGYLESTDGEAAEDIGINCFEELLRRSFFQCLHIYDARERKYGIHDLFHTFAKRVAVECFRIEDSMLSCMPGNISHLSLMPCAVEALVSNLYKQQSDLRTILFVPRSAPKWQGSAVHIKNIRVLNDLFIKFRYLRSLDLSNTDIKALPDSIENLESLCYLSLNNTNIRRLPSSICSLGSLQTLELQDCYFLSDLPPNIKELTKLRCLNVSKESGFISMPSGIGELRNLRTLSNFNVGKVGLHCEIVELQNLLDLRGSLCIAGLENVVSGDQANQANLKMKGCLKTLTLHWFQNGWESEAETEENALDVIQYLQPHTNLEELIIHNYFGSQFPTWLGDPLFCNLVSVTLDNCYESNVLPPLGQLPSLRFLSLQKMDSVRTLGLEFCGSRSGVPCAFPSLEILKLWEMSALEEWNGVQDGDYPKLRSLSISMCFKLKQLPPLNFLRELVFHCCDRLPEIPRLNSVEYLKIDSCQKLEFISLPHDLPALKKLEINNCGQLSLVVGRKLNLKLASGGRHFIYLNSDRSTIKL